MTTPSRETSTSDLKSLIAADLAASNELASRITQLRLDIADGKPLPDKKIDLMERSNKGMTKDLVSRVEKIESSVEALDATDREMLQALNARLAVCDLQAMRLAELRDVEVMARGTQRKAAEQHEVKLEKSEVEPEEHLPPPGERTSHDEDDVEGTGEHGSDSASDSEDKDSGSEYFEDCEIDKSGWPLLYQILDVDPDTMNSDIEPLLNRSYKRLALKHSPQFLPNDPEALARWEKITKAYEILMNPDKRMFYDAHGETPRELEDFDLASLEECRRGFGLQSIDLIGHWISQGCRLIRRHLGVCFAFDKLGSGG